MSFFGGNPFSTPVGQRIEQATDASLASENWALNMEICDIINETEEGPKDAIKAIRKRLQQNAGKNYTVVMYTLTVLESCVKNCGKRFHVLACNKEFVQDLVKLIGPKNDPPTAVQEKVLSLIQSWADAFKIHPELSGVNQVYHDLKQKGVEFPMTDLDTMAPIHTPQRSVPEPDPPAPRGPQHSAARVAQASPQHEIGPVHLTAEQLAKLQSQLDIIQGNMRVLSEMLTELTPGKEHPSDLELLQDLHKTCKAMQQRVVELVDRVANDEVTAELLRVNDELNNLFLRYKRFENNREQEPPAAATQKKEEIATLIDLGENSHTTDLNAQLSGLSLGVGTATSQLNKISSVPAQQGPQNDDSDFDMFAQSRNAMYETTKKSGSTYVDNTNIDLHDSSLGVAVQARHNSADEIVGMHNESDFDEMERWLQEKPVAGSQGPEESITSSEFDRFLAERAAAAESLPSITSSNTRTLPAVNASSTRTQRQLDKEETEKSLFAL